MSYSILPHVSKNQWAIKALTAMQGRKHVGYSYGNVTIVQLFDWYLWDGVANYGDADKQECIPVFQCLEW